MASAREILAGKAAVEIGLRDRLKAGLNAAKARLQDFSVSVASIGISFQSISAVASRAFGILDSVFTGPADQIQNLADRTGLSVEMIQALGEAGADTGATLEDVGGAARAMANFLQTVERDGGAASQSLDDLGISVEQLKAATTQDSRVNLFADALSRIADPARRAALAQDVFGRGAMSLLPQLSSGSAGIEAFRRRLESVGALRDAKAISAADEIGDAIGRLGRRAKSVGFSAILAIAPALSRVLDLTTRVVEAFGKFIAQNPNFARASAVVVMGLFAIAGGLGLVVSSLLILSGAVTAFSAIWSSAMAIATAATMVFDAVAAPELLLIAVACAAAALSLTMLAVASGIALTAFVKWTEAGHNAFGDVLRMLGATLSTVWDIIGGIFDAIIGGDWGLAGDIAMLALRVAMVSGWEEIKRVTASAISWIFGMVVDLAAALPATIASAIDKSIGTHFGDRLTEAAEGLKANVSSQIGNLAADTLATERAALAELEALINLAGERRAASGGEFGKLPFLSDIEAGARGGRQETGTFSGTIASRLGGNTNPTEEVAHNTDEMRKILDELNRKIDGGKLAVVP